MHRFLLRRVIVLAGLALIGGCALFPMGRFHPADDPSASADADADALHSQDQGTSAAADPVGSDPGSSMPQAIPDPLHSIVNPPGKAVAVSGATLTFLGLEPTGDQLRARFDIQSGTVTGAKLVTPSGEVVDLHATGTDLVSDPFGSAASPPAKTAHLDLKVGDRIYLFEAGTAT